jgi:putative membrane protein
MMPWDGMMGWGSGLGMVVGWSMGVVFLGLLVGAGVLLVRALQDQRSLAGGRRESEDRSLAILRERYARGEIDRDEFEAKKRDLTR